MNRTNFPSTGFVFLVSNLLIVIFFLIWVFSPSQAESYLHLNKDAWDSVFREDMDSALALFVSAGKLAADNTSSKADAYLQATNLAINLGKWDQARDYLSITFRNYPQIGYATKSLEVLVAKTPEPLVAANYLNELSMLHDMNMTMLVTAARNYISSLSSEDDKALFRSKLNAKLISD